MKLVSDLLIVFPNSNGLELAMLLKSQVQKKWAKETKQWKLSNGGNGQDEDSKTSMTQMMMY